MLNNSFNGHLIGDNSKVINLNNTTCLLLDRLESLKKNTNFFHDLMTKEKVEFEEYMQFGVSDDPTWEELQNNFLNSECDYINSTEKFKDFLIELIDDLPFVLKLEKSELEKFRILIRKQKISDGRSSDNTNLEVIEYKKEIADLQEQKINRLLKLVGIIKSNDDEKIGLEHEKFLRIIERYLYYLKANRVNLNLFSPNYGVVCSPKTSLEQSANVSNIIGIISTETNLIIFPQVSGDVF
ncbi:MAG: hypothetical protein PHF46_00040 [Candidatus Gracilibacteria bacterium]|nr:hypothetical protein [Candidatus Gracilibacteria bacterium]